ncbi:MAG TPA: GAF domain-containing protein [Anaerolineales bacterium]|nr:GAF domain-containing protein [Anaerolineales bacterium]
MARERSLHLPPELPPDGVVGTASAADQMIKAARDEMLSQMLRNWAIGGATLGVASAWLASSPAGQIRNLVLSLALSVAALGLWRWRRLPYNRRAWLTLGLAFALALASLLNNGVLGAARVFLLAFVVQATVLLGQRVGLIAAGLSLAAWGAGSLATAAGWISPSLVPAPNDLSYWASAALTLIVVGLTLLPAQRMLLVTQSFAVTLAGQKETLETTQQRLIAQTAALGQTRDELAAANDRLNSQRSALSRRASQLEVSAEVARIATTLHDLPTLLDTAAHLVSERFGHYHTGIFLIDDSREWAVLRAASSAAGMRMLARSHRLRVGQQGLVGLVTQTGQSRIVNLVQEDLVHYKNPDLPETRSEGVLPLRSRNEVIGALDVQSVEANAFSDDEVRTLQALADQLAVAIDNARLFQATEQQLAELRKLHESRLERQLVGSEEQPLAFRYDGVEVEAALPVAPAATANAGGEGLLTVPLQIGRQTLGYIEIQAPGGPLTSAERDLTRAVAERMGLALENAQLFRQARDNAQRMEALSTAILRLTGPQDDRARLIEAVAREAMALTNAEGVGVYMASGDRLHLAYSHELPVAVHDETLATGEGLVGRAFQSRRPIRVDDYRSWEGGVAELQSLPIRAALAVPLTWHDANLGVLALTQSQPQRRFSTDDEQIVRLYAAAAASALQNIGLFDEQQDQIRSQTALNRIGQALRNEHRFNLALQEVGRQLEMSFPADSVLIGLALQDSDDIVFPLYREAGQELPLPAQRLRAGPLARLWSTGHAVILDSEAPAPLELEGATPQTSDWRSFLGVPVILGDDVRGVIALANSSVTRAFSDNHLQLLEIIAGTVAVTWHNAQLFAQTEQARIEASHLYEASSALNVSNTAQDLLAALRQHTVLDSASQIMVNVFVGKWSSRGEAPEDSERIALYPEGSHTATPSEIRAHLAPWLRRLLRPDQIVVIEDITEHEGLDASARGIFTIRHNARSALYVPLVVGGEAIGFITALFAEPRSFLPEALNRLMLLARQAAVLIENLLNTHELERRAQQLQTVNAISRAATSIVNVDNLVIKSTELIQEHFNLYYVALFLSDPGGRWAVLKHATGESGRELMAMNHRLEIGGQSMIGQAVYTREAQVANQARLATSRYDNPLLPGTQSELALPLVASDAALGAVSVQSTKPNAFTVADIEVLQSMASQIAIAIRNAQLVGDLERRAQQVAAAAAIGQSVSALLVEEDLLRMAAQQIHERFGFLAVGLYLIDTDGRAQLAQSQGDGGALPQTILASAPDLLGRALSARQPQFGGQVLALPLSAAGASLGMLVALGQGFFSRDDVTVFQPLAEQIAASLGNARQYAREQRTIEQLREVDRLKSQFLANMSHELRTPLNSIIGFSRLMLKGMSGEVSDEQSKDLSIIHQSGQHLLGLINNVLDLSRFEAGKMDLALEVADVRPTIEASAAAINGLIKGRPIELSIELPESLPRVYADPTRLRQVLLNLLGNAAKFTERGRITVTAAATPPRDGRRWVEIAVTDTGVGIAEQDRRKLFERFSQVDDSPTRRHEGSGLGLYISRQLVELHGGRISVNSAGVPGEGSTFTVALPEYLPPEARPAETTQEGALTGG